MSGRHEGAREHARLMDRALALAERARGRTAPNPMVGCVLVQDGEVVGEGWHRGAGTPHAEAVALEAAGSRAAGATAYVTLEPCDHHGRTPPCSEALIRAGVARVVIAARDPDPVARGGLERLRREGVEVVEGVRREEAEEQNAAFLTTRLEGRPLVLYKTAMTLDGKIATRSGASRWITGEAARARVQRWRGELDAVAVGIETVLEDDPLLTVRDASSRSPRKVVFDSTARTPPDAALFRDDPQGARARVTVFTTAAAPETRVAALRARGAEVVEVPACGGRASVSAALRQLPSAGVNGLLLEGGGTLAWSFLAAGAVDRVAWFIAPKLVGGEAPSPLAGAGVERLEDAVALKHVRTERVGGDLLLEARVARDGSA